MGKQSRSRKTDNLGKGKVTPVQIAFIVDRYLSDNNYTQTRSTFRSEASTLLSKSPVHEAPKSLLSLGMMLDEYIRLKEQKVFLDQENGRLENERFRIQSLLRGMQDAMNTYNAEESTTPPPPTVSFARATSAATTSRTDLPVNSSSAGYTVSNTPTLMSTSRPSIPSNPSNFTTPVTNHATLKRRKGSKDVADVQVNAKRSCSHKSDHQLTANGTTSLPQSNNTANDQVNSRALQSSSHAAATREPPVHGSSVAKCLFNQSNQSPPAHSSGPKTPPRATSSHSDKSVSPQEISLPVVSNTPQQITSTDRTIISSETIRVSPAKQVTYYSIERNHISTTSPLKPNSKRPGKREHVKSRLDFDGSAEQDQLESPVPHGVSASESDDGNMFDLDFPNFDALGMDFNITQLLVDFDLDGGGNYQPVTDSSPESLSGSPDAAGYANISNNHVLTEHTSTVTEVLSEKDMNTPGPDSMTCVKSFTKCIKILSPVKNQSFLDQENLS